MTIEVNNETATRPRRARSLRPVPIRARRDAHSSAGGAVRCCSSIPRPWRSCTCSGWMNPGPPMSSRSRWTSCGRHRRTRIRPRGCSETSCCARRRCTSKRGTRVTRSRTSCGCSRRTASCTCSDTTTATRSGEGDVRAAGAAARRLAGRQEDRPVISGDAWMLVGAGVLVVLAGVLAMADAALAAFSRASRRQPRDRRPARSAAASRLVEDPRAGAQCGAAPAAWRARSARVVLVAVVCLDVFTTGLAGGVGRGRRRWWSCRSS